MASRSDGTGRGGLRRATTIATVVVAVACVGYVLAIPIGLVAPDRRLGAGELVLIGFVLLVGVVCSQSSYALTDLSLGADGISAKVERLNLRQDSVESDVTALQVAVTGIVTKFEEIHLTNLASHRPAMVRFGKIMLNELIRLDAIAYLRPVHPRGLIAIEEDQSHNEGEFDLKTYVEITPEGLEYLALRAGLVGARAATTRPTPAA